MSEDSQKISIVLTIYGDDGNLFQILSCIKQQTKTPDEVVIINSLHSEMVNQVIQDFDDLNIKYFYFNQKLLPGGARNEGVKRSIHPLIAFLDSKTLPETKWLEDSFNLIINSKQIFVYGLTQYIAKSEMEKIFLLSLFGKKPALTIPGTLIHRDLFNKIGKFNHLIRAGEDLEWRIRVDANNSINGIAPKIANLRYESISGNIFKQFYRSARNNWSAAHIDAQLNTRAFLLAIVSVFLLIITPNWNRLLGGFLYVPNVTKIYFVFFTIILVLVYLIKPQKIRILTQNLFLPILLILVIATITFPQTIEITILNETSQKFLLELNTFFIYSLLAIGFIFRAFIGPIRLGAKLHDLLPFRWLVMGIVGLTNDLFKTPGYLLGACFTIGRMLKRRLQDFG